MSRLTIQPTNAQLVMAVVRAGDLCTNLRIRECTGIPPLALNGTLGHLCRNNKLERVTIDGEVHYRRPATANEKGEL